MQDNEEAEDNNGDPMQLDNEATTNTNKNGDDPNSQTPSLATNDSDCIDKEIETEETAGIFKPISTQGDLNNGESDHSNRAQNQANDEYSFSAESSAGSSFDESKKGKYKYPPIKPQKELHFSTNGFSSSTEPPVNSEVSYMAQSFYAMAFKPNLSSYAILLTR